MIRYVFNMAQFKKKFREANDAFLKEKLDVLGLAYADVETEGDLKAAREFRMLMELTDAESVDKVSMEQIINGIRNIPRFSGMYEQCHSAEALLGRFRTAKLRHARRVL